MPTARSLADQSAPLRVRRSVDISPNYRVEVITQTDRHLQPVLTADGRPLVLPILWITELSDRARFNTQRSYLTDLALAYRWASNNKVNLQERLNSTMMLRAHEIRHLARRMCAKLDGTPASSSTCRRRLESVSGFISFSIDRYIDSLSDSPLEQVQAERNKIRLLRRLANRMISVRGQGSGVTQATPLTSFELELVSRVLHPLSSENPFQSPRIRFRNYCIYHLALETWARRGEIALLEITDITGGNSPTVRIKAPSTVNQFKRRDGANLKTTGRIVPITSQLSQLLDHYVQNVRDDFLQPRTPTASLFLSEKDGRRIGTGIINSILAQVGRVPTIAALGKRLHPHGLRASGVSLFRRQNRDLVPLISTSDLNDCITYQGGWATNSRMVFHYTRQEISERLGDIVRTKNVLVAKK